MNGRILGHYRVVEKVGEGGMGVVYRARDERLHRDVALKVLPAGTLTDVAARKRFRKEALALASLNHPNIATVYDFDTQDGVDFLVMEYVPGITLNDRLPAGPLSEQVVVDLGTQLAEGIGAAHAQGIVHRDLKPGNLRLTPEGRLKILDFGLARLVGPAADSAATRSVADTGVFAGTLPYMAPEQLRGEPVSASTDVYAAGVVLYELASGRRPFEERTPAALVDSILYTEVSRPGEGRPWVSPWLEAIILRCLAKDPRRRYPSAAMLLADLRRGDASKAGGVEPRAARRFDPRAVAAVAIAGAICLGVALALGFNVMRHRPAATPPHPSITSLAVLPLDNLSHDPNQDYFSDGMTEALIAELSKIRALRVISRTSVMQYKGAKQPMPVIARALGVDGVVEGSVLREGDRVRVTVQLIHAPSDTHLWADSYTREIRDVLSLQGDVARAITDQIRITITPQEQHRLAGAGQVNPGAYEAYLKGRFYWNKRTEDGLQRAVEYFKQASRSDPTYAPAHSGLADSFTLLGGIYGALPPGQAFAEAKVAALEALALDDGLAEAHTSLAMVEYWYDWNWLEAEKQFQRAISLDPRYAPAHQWYAWLLAAMGRTKEALAESSRALDSDPVSLPVNASAIYLLSLARDFDGAVEQCRKTLDLGADFARGRANCGLAYVHTGQYDEAIAQVRQAVTLSQGSPVYVGLLGYAYGRAGRRAEALEVLEKLRRLSVERYVDDYKPALVHIGLGQKAQAVALLERAFTQRSAWLPWLKVDPIFDPLRSAPRFQELVRRMNFPG